MILKIRVGDRSSWSNYVGMSHTETFGPCTKETREQLAVFEKNFHHLPFPVHLLTREINIHNPKEAKTYLTNLATQARAKKYKPRLPKTKKLDLGEIRWILRKLFRKLNPSYHTRFPIYCTLTIQETLNTVVFGLIQYELGAKNFGPFKSGWEFRRWRKSLETTLRKQGLGYHVWTWDQEIHRPTAERIRQFFNTAIGKITNYRALDSQINQALGMVFPELNSNDKN